MNREWLAKLRDLVTALEKFRQRPKDYAYGQRGKNENGRLGRITAPGKDPDSPRLIFPHEDI